MCERTYLFDERGKTLANPRLKTIKEVTRNMVKTQIRQYRYSKDKGSLLTRMRRIEGQAQGIQRMIAEDRYCVDIVQQLTALSAAANEVALLVLQSHIEGCVTEAIQEKRGEEYIKELMEVLGKALRR
jgi:DNA-binding FrmR family transcriptional regulator